MGQQEILRVLSAQPQHWFTTQELSEATGVTLGATATALRRLRRCRMVDFTMATRQGKNPVAIYKGKS